MVNDYPTNIPRIWTCMDAGCRPWSAHAHAPCAAAHRFPWTDAQSFRVRVNSLCISGSTDLLLVVQLEVNSHFLQKQNNIQINF